MKLSAIDKDKLIFLPMTVDLGDNVKVTITESDLEQFPGLYMTGCGNSSLKGSHAAYPKNSKQGGHNNLQMEVTERENFIAKTAGTRSYPWRVAIITDNDRGSCGIQSFISACLSFKIKGYQLDKARESGLGMVERQQYHRCGL